MVRWFAVAVVLSALGCGGGSGPGKAPGRAPVTEADVRALIGRPAGDAVKLLGTPDRDEGTSLGWHDAPTAVGPRVIGVQYDQKTGAVIFVHFTPRPTAERPPPGTPGFPGVPSKNRKLDQ